MPGTPQWSRPEMAEMETADVPPAVLAAVDDDLDAARAELETAAVH